MKKYDFRLSQEAWQKALETYTKAKRQMEESKQQLHQSLDKIEQGWNSEGGRDTVERGRRIVAQKVQAAQEQLDWVESLQKQFAQLQSVREQSVTAQPTGMQSAQMQPAQGQSTSTKDSKETIPSWSQLLTRSELTEKEQEQLCRELETLCKEQDETQLKEVYRLLLLETYETRTTGSGEYLYYSLETDQTKTELLKNKSKALGLTRTEKLMKSLETLDTEAVRVADKTSGSFTIETYETKEPGEIRLLLAVSYTVKDGLPKEGYSREILLETDPDVDAMTDEEVVQFMEKTDNAFLLARIFAKGKQKVYNKRQQLARRYYGIKRQQGKEQALTYGILEDLPYLFGEVPYLDGEELTAWSERQKEAFQRYLQLVEQGVDFTWIENYYRTEAMKEAEKELKEELEEELEDSAKSPLDHSIDSILMKPLASLGAGAYQLYGFVTGTPLDPENGMYGGTRRVELIRRVVAEGFDEDLPGRLAEALYEVALVGIEAYADTGYQAVQRGLCGTAVQSEAVLAATGDMLLEKLLHTSLLEAGTSYLKEMCRGGFVGAGTETLNTLADYLVAGRTAGSGKPTAAIWKQAKPQKKQNSWYVQQKPRRSSGASLQEPPWPEQPIFWGEFSQRGKQERQR